MAGVIALIPDLLFGSRVQSALTAAGHEVEMLATRSDVESRLRRAGPPARVLIVDLTDERVQGPELVEALREGAPSVPSGSAPVPSRSPLEPPGSLAPPTRPKTLGFYSHVDTATRERAERAGFDLVVPRSRMAREAPALVERLAACSA